MARAVIGPGTVTLGLLAGGQGRRLGGVDKAWLERDGVPQVLRLADRFRAGVASVLVSANRGHDRLAAHGLRPVADRHPGFGPLAGLDALAAACGTPWLLTLPVDVAHVEAAVLPGLGVVATDTGAFVEDDDGPQPLVALWRVRALRPACADAIRAGRHAAMALVDALGMGRLRLRGVRLGNLNTPADLAGHGIVRPGQ